jgi:hypothetical protein
MKLSTRDAVSYCSSPDVIIMFADNAATACAEAEEDFDVWVR